MNILNEVKKAVGNAVNFVGEKNRKAAYVNRIRAVIGREEKAAEKEYLALGRYYYNNLRDHGNPVSEAHCAELDAIEERLDKALGQLEQFYEAERAEKEAECCCCCEDEEEEPAAEEITLDDVQSYDSDPMPEEAPAEEAPAEPAPVEEASAVPVSAEVAPAEQDENDDLPFEG